ncbi:MAG: hypothetical protein KGV59_05665 [Tenacibaculum sp.]|nr:hypothetical protein [Tenacibaculum sp.]
MDLKFNDDLDTIKDSLKHTLTKIKDEGENPLLKAEMLYKFSRYKFSEKEYDECHETLDQLNTHLAENNLPKNYEIFYWLGRVFEEKEEYINAKTTYLTLLTRIKKLDETKELENEILDRINVVNKILEK